MRLITTCILLFLDFYSLKAQVTSFVLWEEPTDSTSINRLNSYCKDSAYTKPEFTLYNGRFALEAAQKTTFIDGQTNAYLNMGHAKIYLNDLDSALIFANKALQLSQGNNVKLSVAAYELKGSLYSYKEDYDKAISEYIKGIVESEKSEEKLALKCIFNLSHAFMRINNTEKAEFYAQKSYRMSLKYNDSLVMIASLNVMGILDKNQDSLDLALDHYNEGLSIAILNKNDKLQSQIMFNMANIFFRQDNSKKGFELFRASLEMSKLDSNYQHIAENYHSLSFKYMEVGNLREANKFADTSLHYSLLSEKYSLIMEAYSLKSEVASKLDKDKKAYDYLLMAFNYKDSLNLADMSAASLQYEDSYEKRKAHLADSLKQIQFDQKIKTDKNISNQRLKARDRLIWIFSLVLLIVGCGLYLLFKRNNVIKQQSQLVNDQKKEIEIRHQEMKEAKEAAEEQKRIKEQFLSNTSHEIRAPLHSIIGSADLLLKKNQQQDNQLLRTITNSGKYLLTVVNDILDKSKLESGKLRIELMLIDIRKMLNEILDVFRNEAEEKNIELDLLISEDVPSIVTLDPTRIRQVVVNLVCNALKFTEKGYVMLSVGVKNMTLNIEVVDSGVGIKEEKLETIFEVFTQESISTTRDFGGSGLGLSITKQLIELMNGSISVKSKVGEGTCFKVEIPLIIEGKEGDVHIKEEKLIDIYDLKSLIIDDNSISASTIKQQLEYLNGDAAIVQNGKDGLERIKEIEYDIVFLDLNLPGTNGIDVAKDIWNDINQPQLKVVCISGSDLSNKKESSSEELFDIFLRKPFDLLELSDVLRKLFPNQKILTNNQELDSENRDSNASLVFISEIPSLMKSILDARNMKNIEMLRFLVHKVKPCYFYIGENMLYNYIDDFENRFTSFTEELIFEKIQYIEDETKLILKKLKKYET